jgi:lipopolysaccharide biosynthesis regulator YciM
VPALRLLAQLQEGKGDAADALQTYQELTKAPNLPKEMRQEIDLLRGQLYLRAGKFDDAEKLLDGLRTSLPASDPQRATALVYLAQAQIAMNKLGDVEANVKAALAGASDPAVKGLAHNTLGDYYRKKGLNEEAFWEYLRVDALYSQDRNEHAKALYYLAKLFADVKKDKGKSQECLDKLKLLDETPFAKLAATEK